MIREKNKQKELLTTLKIKFYRREADIYKSCKICQIKPLAFFLIFFSSSQEWLAKERVIAKGYWGWMNE